MSDTEIHALLYDLETIATTAGPGPARELALRCEIMLEQLTAENTRLREQRDAAASVAHKFGTALYGAATSSTRKWWWHVFAMEAADPAEATRIVALVFGEGEEADR